MIKSKVYVQVAPSLFQVQRPYFYVLFSMLLAVLMLAGVLGTTAVYAAPSAIIPGQTFEVFENSATGTPVGTVLATDATSFAIVGGNELSAFAINSTSGLLTVADGTQVNYEMTPQFTMTIRLNDDSATDETVIINVTDLNDPPVVAGFHAFTAPESLNMGETVGTIIATDPDGNDLAYTIVMWIGGAGPFDVDNDGNVVVAGLLDYETPPTAYSFIVEVSDGGLVNTTVVTVDILDVNDPPVANDDTGYTVDEADPNLIVTSPTLLFNDEDEDGDELSVALASVTQPAYGSVVVAPDGTFIYTPTAQFNGIVTFTYQAQDDGVGNLLSNVATVTITVTGDNDAPTAVDDTYATDEDTALNILAEGVLGNDTDPEDDPLTVSGFDALSTMGAAVSVAADGGFSYDPTGSATIQALDAGDTDTDTFTYTISDGNDGFDTATVFINLDGLNDAPVAVDDANATDEDTVLNVPAPGVLSNDADIDADDNPEVSNFDAISANDAAVFMAADGSFSYDPTVSAILQAMKAGDPAILDTFTYEISDGALSDTATVTVTVTAVNDDPTAVDDTFTVNEDSVNNILEVLSNDSTEPETGETLTITAVGTTDNGGLATNNSTDIIYTPALNFSGAEVFTYTIGDGNGGFDTAVVTVTVQSDNDVPVISEGAAITVTMDEDGNPLAFGLTLNATDADNDTLTWSISAQGLNGTAVAAGTGASKAIDYAPNANYNGNDSFEVQVSDGNGGTDTIIVTVIIAPQNDAPTANDDFPIVDEQSSNNTLDVLANDSDAPDSGETLTIVAVGATDNGGAVTNNGTDITYTPDLAFIGTEVFTYTINDGTPGSLATATVTVTVQNVNFAPEIAEGTAITVSMDEDGVPLAFALTLNATDADDDTLTWSISAQGLNGTAVAAGTGDFKAIDYAPNAHYNGNDSFEVQVSDGNGGTDTIIVTVIIAPQNDAPTANDDFPTVDEQSSNNILDVLANDSDAPDSGETLTIVAVGATDNGGSVTNNGTDITYTPDFAFIGTEVFTYTINDGTPGSLATATVTVDVQNVNFAPEIAEGASITVTMSEDGSPTPFALTLNATDVDGNMLTWSIFSQGSNGTASASGTGGSKPINYTPDGDYNGSDSFVVQVSDGNGGTDTITVNVVIDPENDAPTAVDDNATTATDTAVLIYVLNNDDDIDGDGLSVSAVTNGTDGSVTNHGTHVEYTPNTGFDGIDTFTYTANDGNGGTSVATVTVIVGNAYATFLPIIVKPGPQAPDLVVTNINASSDLIEVVIENQGNVPVLNSFWVDFYIDPSPAPMAANELWPELANEGLAWGVTDGVAVGEIITLTYSTAPGALNLYFVAEQSLYYGSLPAATPVYAQVDSAHAGIGNGAITELDELGYGPYNNILGDVASAAP